MSLATGDALWVVVVTAAGRRKSLCFAWTGPHAVLRLDFAETSSLRCDFNNVRREKIPGGPYENLEVQESKEFQIK